MRLGASQRLASRALSCGIGRYASLPLPSLLLAKITFDVFPKREGQEMVLYIFPKTPKPISDVAGTASV
jgi:hypothetical protein